MDISALERLQKVFAAIDNDSSLKGNIPKIPANDSSPNPSQSTEIIGRTQMHNWVKYFDATTSRYYYHDSVENLTQWEVPHDYVELSSVNASSKNGADLYTSRHHFQTLQVRLRCLEMGLIGRK